MINSLGVHSEKGVFLTHEEYNIFVALEEEKREQDIEIAYLKQELAQIKRMIFGSKSERFIQEDPGQLELGLDVEKKEAPEAETEQLSFTRRKPKGKKQESPIRLPLPSHLHREEILIEPQEDVTGGKKIGEVVTEILEYTPGKFYVEKYIRPKYALPEDKGIVIGNLPSLPIPRGNAGPGLLAHIVISKFQDHLPFYRQIQQFKRADITIAESTLNGWFSATCRLLEPLYERLVELIKKSHYLMADETPIPVLTKDKPGSTHKGYHWVYYSPMDKLVCFDYRKGRGREGPEVFLEGFQGTLQTDGYAGYNEFEKKQGITLLACMAHSRRKYEQSLDNDPERARYALERIQDLYKVERQAREEGLSFEQRKELRLKKSKPVLEELESWMKKQLPEVLPKSAIGKAITYTLKLWPRLVRYTEDGRWEVDNNLIENSIRPSALGRKNFLFAGSHEGAKRAAMMYSFLGTCKINNVEPLAWLKDVLTRIPDHSIHKLEELL
ncbi:MAG TPA: IS66 family transposase, partial [Thermodesulfobacteriota bacterium]|nr:IS66 family transposase [Thermodesulfobacteriota bacterium]